MTRTYVAREITGDLLFDYLTDHDATRAEACEDLGISPTQFEYGLQYIKDILAADQAEPLTYDPRTYRYSLALQEREAKAYEQYRLKIMHKTMGRLLTGTAEPHAKKFDSAAARRLVRHVSVVMEDLQDLAREMAE